jgi:hypothetical protein
MIQEVTMFTIICDGCGKDVCDGTEYSAWYDTSYVVDSAIEENWHVEDGKHYCPDCFEYDDDDNLIIKGGNK